MIEETVLETQKHIPNQNEVFDLIIIGSGPAGMSAAICAGRADLKTLIIEKALPGGQVSTSFNVDNCLGFPGGILGEELALRMEEHLFNYNIYYSCESVETISDPYSSIKTVRTDLDHVYRTKTIILAIGLDPQKLNASFESQFLGRGISYFAKCDADYYKGKDIAVIGGGNCACYAADYLSQFANNLYLIHRSDSLKSVKTLKEKVMGNPKISIMWHSEVTDVFGIDKVEKIKVTNITNDQYTWIDVKAIFIYSGRIPPKNLFGLDINRDEKGYIITDEYMRTNLPGIFAAGDIRSKQIRQIPTAISDGMVAGVNIGKELKD